MTPFRAELFSQRRTLRTPGPIIEMNHSEQPIDQRYLVQQRKVGTADKELPVFARTMKGKDGTFEGVSFIRNKDKASVMTLEEANQVIAWAKKKPMAASYVTTIICKGQ